MDMSKEFVKFSYSGSLGPENWASLSSSFQLCGKGAHQSPINIQTNAAVYDSSLEILKRDYIAANATLVNNGFNIGVCKNPITS
jgi:carbonic anhydrase